MDIIAFIKEKLFNKAAPLPPGIYHYTSPPEAEKPIRYHLRIEPSGEGILIVNASTVMHLNQTAAEYAYHLINKHSIEETLQAMAPRYNIPPDVIKEDFHNFTDNLTDLIESPDLDPVTFFDVERTTPYEKRSTAPYRLDCALTYRLAQGLDEAVSPLERVNRELTNAEWQVILNKAWDAGIPHVIFTGGEPTLRPDLAGLIEFAESLGMVTGLLTDGERLADTHYLHELLQKGLDHIIITIDPFDRTAFEGLRDCLAEDIHVTAHITVTKENHESILHLLPHLASLGVRSVSLCAASENLITYLLEAQQKAHDLELSLVWDIPVPYSRFNPISMELKANQQYKDGAATAWLYVEPDGDVLPAQGNTVKLGNFLSDPWTTIWENAKKYVDEN